MLLLAKVHADWTVRQRARGPAVAGVGLVRDREEKFDIKTQACPGGDDDTSMQE